MPVYRDRLTARQRESANAVPVTTASAAPGFQFTDQRTTSVVQARQQELIQRQVFSSTQPVIQMNPYDRIIDATGASNDVLNGILIGGLTNPITPAVSGAAAMGLTFGANLGGGVPFGAIAVGTGAVQTGQGVARMARHAGASYTNSHFRHIRQEQLFRGGHDTLHGLTAAYIGGLGILAGLLAIPALFIPVLGLPAFILGMTAAGAGLAYLAWKIGEHLLDRHLEADRTAKSLVNAYLSGNLHPGLVQDRYLLDLIQQAAIEGRKGVGRVLAHAPLVGPWHRLRSYIRERSISWKNGAAIELYQCFRNPNHPYHQEALEIVRRLRLDPARILREPGQAIAYITKAL